jgi:hypothetical protein
MSAGLDNLPTEQVDSMAVHQVVFGTTFGAAAEVVHQTSAQLLVHMLLDLRPQVVVVVEQAGADVTAQPQVLEEARIL